MCADVNIEQLLDCAVAAVHAAGDYALENIDRRKEVVQALAHDVKLRLDVECQAKAEELISSRFPEHAMIGEEDPPTENDGEAPPGDGYEWIIDPIDGTFNFMRGLQRWCCSIAVRRNGEVLAGAVYAPELKKLFTATVDGPALCNGRAIKVSGAAALSEAMIFTGVDKNVNPALPPFEIYRSIAINVQKTRIMGAAAIDICSVASGEGDGYFESGIYIWDIAAAGLILTRAGGTAEILKYQDRQAHRLIFLATNTHIHQALKTVVTSRL